MNTGSEKLALALGIANAERLPFLGAALNGAKAFHEWATALGYRSVLLTDDDDSVTTVRLRQELDELLPAPGEQAHRLVIYFAGHGLIREAEEGLWLLSDWYSELRAVAMEPLKRRLYRYPVDQIAIISDACRVLPKDVDTSDVTADAVLGRGHLHRATLPPTDRFVAAQDGAAAYAVPGASEEDDRCFFSGVLMEGLWGLAPDAYSKIQTDRVTSRSLGTFLQTQVPVVAERYGQTLHPQVYPLFPEGDDVYFTSKDPVPPPTLPGWPPPDDVATDRFDLGTRGPGGGAAPPSDSAPRMEGLRRWSHSLRKGLARPDLSVSGASPHRIWTRPSLVARPEYGRDDHEWVLDRERTAHGSSEPILIEFASDRIATMAALPGFVAHIEIQSDSFVGLAYQPLDKEGFGGHVALDAIEAMERGALRADSVVELTVQLRQSKHVDPVLGVISAYLYDAIGDVQSIRAMAYYYAVLGQAIPFDIALLGQLEGRWDGSKLEAHVPAVPKRTPRSPEEKAFTWTHEATDATSGAVGGLWPWMRQGWAFLEEPTGDGSSMVLPPVADASSGVRSGRFTTLDEASALLIAESFGLSASGTAGQRVLG